MPEDVAVTHIMVTRVTSMLLYF